MSEHILVVDDDDRLRGLLRKYLREHGFDVSTAASAAQARGVMALFAVDLLVLDVMMPGETGLSLAASLGTGAPPVLMLSARGQASERIEGLEAGADDYLPKPFEPKELLLRIHAILKRAPQAKVKAARQIAFGDFVYDLDGGQLSRAGAPVYLTTAEGSLLRALAEQAGKAVSREELGTRIGVVGERAVDVQVTRLRRKIEPEGRPVYIQTVRGAGYGLFPA